MICGEDATDLGLASGQGDVQKRVIARFDRGDLRAVDDDVGVGEDVALLRDEEDRAAADCSTIVYHDPLWEMRTIWTGGYYCSALGTRPPRAQ